MKILRQKTYSESKTPIWDRYKKNRLSPNQRKYDTEEADREKRTPLRAYHDDNVLYPDVSKAEMEKMNLDDITREDEKGVDEKIIKNSKRRGTKEGRIVGGVTGSLLGGTLGAGINAMKNKKAGVGALIGAGAGGASLGLLVGQSKGKKHEKYAKKVTDKRRKESQARYKEKSSV